MTTLTLGLSVTTPDITAITGDFTLADGDAQLVSYDPGGLVKRRSVLRSPSVRGGRQQSSQPEQRLIVVRLRIFGTTKGGLDDNIDLWQQVFDQHRYHLTVSVNTVATTWACDDADSNVLNDNGEGVDKYRLMASPMRQLWEFRIPADPDPTAGVF